MYTELLMLRVEDKRDRRQDLLARLVELMISSFFRFKEDNKIKVIVMTKAFDSNYGVGCTDFVILCKCYLLEIQTNMLV